MLLYTHTLTHTLLLGWGQSLMVLLHLLVEMSCALKHQVCIWNDIELLWSCYSWWCRFQEMFKYFMSVYWISLDMSQHFAGYIHCWQNTSTHHTFFFSTRRRKYKPTYKCVRSQNGCCPKFPLSFNGVFKKFWRMWVQIIKPMRETFIACCLLLPSVSVSHLPFFSQKKA